MSARSKSLSLGIASALLFSFVEGILFEASSDKAAISGDYFYFAGLAASFVLAMGFYAAIVLSLKAFSRIRPAIDVAAGALVAFFALGAYMLMGETRQVAAAGISDIYIRPGIGPLLSTAVFAVVLYPILLFFFIYVISRARKNSQTAERKRKRWPAHLASIAVLAPFCLLEWRDLYQTFLSIPLLYLGVVFLPVLTAKPAYVCISRLRDSGRAGLARTAFAIAVFAAGIYLGLHESRQGASGRYTILFTAGGFLMAVASYFSVRPRALPPALAGAGLLVMIAPFAEAYWTPRVDNSIDGGEHILLISVDTLRSDALSAYNPDTLPTPAIDAIFHDGVRFTRAWSVASWTLPSVVSMLTGVSPAVHQTDYIDEGIPGNLPTLAEYLGDRGYVTEGIVDNLLLSPDRSMDRGFDRYMNFPLSPGSETCGMRLLAALWPERYSLRGGARDLCEIAWRRIRRHRDEPFFLWLHLYEPHSPYRPPACFWPESIPSDAQFPDVNNSTFAGKVEEKVLKGDMHDLYLGEVQYVDAAVGGLLDRLRKTGDYDKMIIIFTSDHGEEFGEHGRWGHGNPPAEPLVRVPFGIKPAGSTRGVVSDEIVTNAAIPSLVLNAVDPSFRQPEQMLGRPLHVPDSVDHRAGQPQPIFITSIPKRNQHVQALVFGDTPFKYCLDEVTGEESLFDLESDPGELNSLVSSRPELLDQARKAYSSLWDASRRIRDEIELQTVKSVVISDKSLQHLKKLGYVE